jgi:hypothetical protein
MEVRKSVWAAPAKGDAVTLTPEGACTVAHVDQDDAGICWIVDLAKV